MRKPRRFIKRARYYITLGTHIHPNAFTRFIFFPWVVYDFIVFCTHVAVYVNIYGMHRAIRILCHKNREDDNKCVCVLHVALVTWNSVRSVWSKYKYYIIIYLLYCKRDVDVLYRSLWWSYCHARYRDGSVFCVVSIISNIVYLYVANCATKTIFLYDVIKIFYLLLYQYVRRDVDIAAAEIFWKIITIILFYIMHTIYKFTI